MQTAIRRLTDPTDRLEYGGAPTLVTDRLEYGGAPTLSTDRMGYGGAPTLYRHRQTGMFNKSPLTSNAQRYSMGP